MELLTKKIACTYRERAKALPYNGMQDIGERGHCVRNCRRDAD